MTHDQLSKFVKEELDTAYGVLQYKNEGYSTEKEPLHNFNMAAELQNCSPAKALGGFLAKHVVSIYDLINSTPINEDFSLWHEKITDAIVYLAILHAMMEEEAEKIKKEVHNA